MYKQRLLDHTIADNAATAAPVERKDISRDHACDVCLGERRFGSVPKRALGANLCGLAEVQTQEGERGGCTYLESSSDWRALGLRADASRCVMLCRARPILAN